MQREIDQVEKERDRAVHELKLSRQQAEHRDKEHLDALEKVKLSYEAEISVIRREKEEVRARLVEASQSPDVKRLIELSEDNQRLSRKLQSAHATIEQTEQQYRAIQKRIEEFVLDQERKEKSHENEVAVVQQQLEQHRQEVKGLRAELAARKSDIEDLLAQIGALKRIEEKLKFEVSQQAIRFNEELEELRLKKEREVALLKQEKTSANDEMKSEIIPLRIHFALMQFP